MSADEIALTSKLEVIGNCRTEIQSSSNSYNFPSGLIDKYVMMQPAAVKHFSMY